MVLAVRGQTFEDDIGRWLHGEQLSEQSVFHSGETVCFTEDKYSRYSGILSRTYFDPRDRWNAIRFSKRNTLLVPAYVYIHEHARARAHTHTHIHTHADIYMYEVSNVTTSHVCTISKNRRALLSFTIR